MTRGERLCLNVGIPPEDLFPPGFPFIQKRDGMMSLFWLCLGNLQYYLGFTIASKDTERGLTMPGHTLD